MPAAKALGVGVMRDFRATNICAKKIKKAKICLMVSIRDLHYVYQEREKTELLQFIYDQEKD